MTDNESLFYDSYELRTMVAHTREEVTRLKTFTDDQLEKGDDYDLFQCHSISEACTNASRAEMEERVLY
jgi:hypothetical protein